MRLQLTLKYKITSLEIFRQRLKTELFSRSFMSPNIQTIRKHSV